MGVHIVFKPALCLNRHISRTPTCQVQSKGRASGNTNRQLYCLTKPSRATARSSTKIMHTHMHKNTQAHTNHGIKFRCEVLFGLDRPQRQNKVCLSTLSPVNRVFFYKKLPLWDVNQFFSPFPALMTQCRSNQLQALKTHFPERAEHTKMFDWGDPFTYLPNLCLLRNQTPTFSAKHKSSKQAIWKWLKISWQ